MRRNNTVGVRIHGLRALDRALGKANKGLRRNLREGLKDIAAGVARDARSVAESKGLRESGDLIAGIRPYALTGRAGVRSSATHRGFNYPRRLEYEHGGRRASLNPAVTANQDNIVREVDAWLDNLESDFTRGPQ